MTWTRNTCKEKKRGQMLNIHGKKLTYGSSRVRLAKDEEVHIARPEEVDEFYEECIEVALDSGAVNMWRVGMWHQPTRSKSPLAAVRDQTLWRQVVLESRTKNSSLCALVAGFAASEKDRISSSPSRLPES